MAKGADPQLQVADVYDLAADIGKEFEKVIDVHGVDTVKELMTKVIITLEYLESSAVIIDTLENELSDIKAKVEQLEYEKLEKAEFRSRLDEELEQIEENWRKEINQLNALVLKLQEENKRLNKIVADQQETQSPDKYQALFSDEYLDEFQKLKGVTECQRSQLIHKEKELLQKNGALEKLQYDFESVKGANEKLSHKNTALQEQLEQQTSEKSVLQAYVQKQQKDIIYLSKKFNIAVKENMDLVLAEGKPSINLAGKIVMDADDPHRPIFTLDELRHILQDKNDYKVKVSDLEDMLSLHQAKSVSLPSSSVCTKSVSSSSEELPVQGPINREPDEKLYPGKKSSIIRRFFSFRFLRRFSLESPEQLLTFSASP